jgi:beta-glucosidase
VDFEKGKKYCIEVEYTNYRPPVTTPTSRRQPALIMAALRLGGGPHISDTQKAIADAVALARSCDAVICVIGSNMDWEAEGADREGIDLPGKTDELVTRLLAVCPEAVICNQSGSAFGFPWADNATTLLQTWFGGNETGHAIADVLFGKVNPSGRLPLSFPHQIEDCTAHLNWQAENGVVNYGEGIFVGYRGYEETKRPPAFAFGEGLSYTSFSWSDLQIHAKEGQGADDLLVTINLKVRNNGSRQGADVVQIYVVDKVCSLRRPSKELKGFAKVSLKPNQEETVSVELDKFAFSFYDDDKAMWVVEKGAFEIRACRSSKPEDVIVTTDWHAEKAYEWTGL